MKLGLVLGGSGLSGFLNLALVEWIEQQALPVSMMASSGTGSLVAALWSKGFAAPEIERILQELIPHYAKAKPDLYTFFSFFANFLGQFKMDHALMKAQTFQKKYRDWFGDTLIEDLTIPSVLMSTDVHSGKTIPIRSGLLADAVYASSALLPFFPPLKIGTQWLGDGSFTAPFPIQELSNNGIDQIVVMYFEEAEQKKVSKKVKFIDLYASFLNRSIYKSQKTRMALALDLHHDEIIFIKVKLEEAMAYDVQRFKEALAHVRTIVREKLKHWDTQPFKK